ncbi:GNAT family N-acetyltransferase [Exiguobacterium sp. SL-10]|jgi:GNAT superfamily N-acetyltransferase|uniref:GNAT family N-acetyltransferase n=1 Tax=Exiguobacterium sp. SL-10 TaxID=2510962 RepID=UPI001040086C|nr:GNAT family N-acetyltransferase [Exiguobacterium sp. SL-10]TCI29240.1 GNAT family N-acetyltransferase [Exiguobacterium sp. SL-10]
MQIREATVSDHKVFTEVSRASFKQEADRLRLPYRDLNIEPPGYDNESMNRYLIEQLTCYVIELDGQVIGGTVVTLTGQEYGRIDRMFIHPEQQGRGIGKRALQLIEGLHPTVRIWELETSAAQPNNVAFYRAAGYQSVFESDVEVCFIKRVKRPIDEAITFRYEERSIKGAQAYGVDASQLAITNSNISELRASNCNFTRSQFRNINFRESEFDDLNLSGSQYRFVTMFESGRPTTFFHTNLTSTIMKNCRLDGMQIEDSSIDGLTIDGVHIKDLLEHYRKETGGMKRYE